MKTYIGYSSDIKVRYKATSGGVGSTIVKYLLENGIADYALNFIYDSEHLCYQPTIISSFSDYNICGSIYQEMNLAKWLKDTLNQLPKAGKIVLFSLPCQTKVLRKICIEAGFSPFVIGLTCSSQQSYEATQYLLSRINLTEKDVAFLQYRGNGWPSGIQIKTKDCREYFVDNNRSVWTEIFHSRLFIQPRCYFCKNTLNDFADIVLADPWLKKYIEEEKNGQTLFATYSDLGDKYMSDILKEGFVIAQEVDNSFMYKSQESTIKRKLAYNSHPLIRKWMRKIYLSNFYKRLALCPILFGMHCKVKTKIEYFLCL